MIILSVAAIYEKALDRPAGYVQDVLAAGTIIPADDGQPEHVAIPSKSFDALVEKYDPGAKRRYEFGGGPGTELKKLLANVGMTSTANCKCNSRAALMDANGCDWCEAHTEEIVSWLREEATERGLPFLDVAGRLLVRRAIANARRKEAASGTEDRPPLHAER